MSTEPADGRNRLVVPVAGLAIIAVVFVLFLLVRGGGDEEKPAATPTRTTAPADAVQPETAKLKGSGDAPKAIAVKAATVARGAVNLGLAADLPDIDLKKFDTVTLMVGQDDGATLWNLEVIRDPRGAFISPQLTRAKNGQDQQFACSGAALRVSATRLTMTMPLTCLDDPEDPVRVRLEITDADGGKETTTTSKVIDAVKG